MEAQSAVASSVCCRLSRGLTQVHVRYITRTLVHVARLTWSGALILQRLVQSCSESGQASCESEVGTFLLGVIG